MKDEMQNKIDLIKDKSLKDRLSPRGKRKLEEIAQQERKSISWNLSS